ncbi:MAG: imidazole glycerol phosphate synthase subunit HisH [Firmicutes bacterium]|nr:imidazole glycerol phosphate synthase subunit HisH [Bacillota bacterium]
MIAIINYGAGNLCSVEKAFTYLGYRAFVTSDPKIVSEADRVVLPGVGAFGKSMERLEQAGMIPVVKEIIASGRPFLGICLGLQMLFQESAEVFGEMTAKAKGLGIFRGEALRFETTRFKVPQIGWNRIKISKESPIFHGIKDGSFFYFVHSYYVKPAVTELVACTTEYDIEYCSGISRGNIHAFQFHPEKSGQVGLKLLKNFAELN